VAMGPEGVRPGGCFGRGGGGGAAGWAGGPGRAGPPARQGDFLRCLLNSGNSLRNLRFRGNRPERPAAGQWRSRRKGKRVPKTVGKRVFRFLHYTGSSWLGLLSKRQSIEPEKDRLPGEIIQSLFTMEEERLQSEETARKSSKPREKGMT